MLPRIRDLMATIVFEKRLSVLREEYLERALSGDTPPPEFWEKGERAALQLVRERFYGPEVQAAMAGQKGSSGAATGFEDRTQKLVERGIVFSHRRLASLPHVGHPDFEAGERAVPDPSAG